MSNETQEIKINVSLDANKVPEKISWEASEGAGKQDCGAALMAIWDRKENSALRIDLWDKDFTMDEMKMLVHQTVLTLADSYERATSDKKLAGDMRDFGHYFAVEAKLVDESK